MCRAELLQTLTVEQTLGPLVSSQPLGFLRTVIEVLNLLDNHLVQLPLIVPVLNDHVST
jgi:hypothetical protein